MQRVDDRVTARAALLIARRQEDNGVAVDGIAFQIAFERSAVNDDVLDSRRPGPDDDIGHVRLDLRNGRKGADCRGESRGKSGHAPSLYREVAHIVLGFVSAPEGIRKGDKDEEPMALCYLDEISTTATVYGSRSIVRSGL
ncbi:MAG TPA: hypothetical protein VH436_32840 [Vicinamibacterales bacterium]